MVYRALFCWNKSVFRRFPPPAQDKKKSLMLCALILCVSGRTYSLTSTPNDRDTFPWQVYLLSQFSATNLLRGNRRNSYNSKVVVRSEIGDQNVTPYFLNAILLAIMTTFNTNCYRLPNIGARIYTSFSSPHFILRSWCIKYLTPMVVYPNNPSL